METFYIVWPEEGLVSAAKIVGWFEDAVADGKIEEDYLDAKFPQEMAQALDNAGIITLGKEPDYGDRVMAREDAYYDNAYDRAFRD